MNRQENSYYSCIKLQSYKYIFVIWYMKLIITIFWYKPEMFSLNGDGMHETEALIHAPFILSIISF